MKLKEIFPKIDNIRHKDILEGIKTKVNISDTITSSQLKEVESIGVYELQRSGKGIVITILII